MEEAVLSTKAPPARVFLQALQLQIPTDARFMENFPQKSHRYCSYVLFVVSVWMLCLLLVGCGRKGQDREVEQCKPIDDHPKDDRDGA